MAHETATSRVTRGLGASLPARVRRALRVEPGDTLVWQIDDRTVTVRAEPRKRAVFSAPEYRGVDGPGQKDPKEHDEVF